jgi:hypothetical protein
MPSLMVCVRACVHVCARTCVSLCLRVRQQDVSRLVDLCRQTIVFASLQSLLAGLRVIAADPDVQVSEW